MRSKVLDRTGIPVVMPIQSYVSIQLEPIKLSKKDILILRLKNFIFKASMLFGFILSVTLFFLGITQTADDVLRLLLAQFGIFI